MKKFMMVAITLIALAFSLTSCEKGVLKENCNCGLVLSDRVTDYSVVIRNSCSKNEQRFYLQPGDWMNAHPGSQYCITNVSGW